MNQRLYISGTAGLTLTAQLSAAGTTATFAAGSTAGWPALTDGDFILLTLTQGTGAETSKEVVKVTAFTTGTATISQRAIEGAAAIWPIGSKFECRETATEKNNAPLAASNAIPLTRRGATMASAFVGAATAFAPAAAPMPGASLSTTLYSDGVNIPTFPGFLEAASSSGFDASAVGAVNYVDFWRDDRNSWYSVTQPTPNTPDLTFPGLLPVVKYISTSADGSKILVTFNVPLATATAPGIAQFTPNGRTVTAAALSNGGLTLTLTLSAAYVGGNTATLTYAQGSGPLTSAGNGNLLAAFTNKAVTNLVGVSTPLQFALTGSVTENADTPAAGQYTYSTTASAFSVNTGVTTRSLPASTDGFVTADGAFTVGQGQFMLALKAASTAGGYLTFAASIGVTNTGKYATSTGGSQTASSFAYTPGDQMRLRRTAGNIIAEFATAAAPSVWIPILTLATANTVQLWAAFDAGTGTGTRALTNPQASASFV